MELSIESSWKEQLSGEFEKPYFKMLTQFIEAEYQSHICYPPAAQIFAAFDHCSFKNVRVVILGQDPYHGPGQANGLCFSVSPMVRTPPSLVNIYKEIQSDLGLPIPPSGDLTRWADQGVLLLNATLTVRSGGAGSHQKKGWEQFTDAVIRAINEQKTNVVFILWGAYAQKKGAFIDQEKHLVLKGIHPSPLSAYGGFFGCKHFSKANDYLHQHKLPMINW